MPRSNHPTRPTRPLAAALLATALPAGAGGQTTLDRVDPAKVEQALPRPAPATATLPATAAPAAASAPAAGPPITVGAVVLGGLAALRPSDFADVFELYVGRTLSPAALAGLADAVAERARQRGYLFATATIPPQAVEAGVLRIVVDEGRVDEVRLVGSDNRAVAAALAPLAGGAPVTAGQLQRRLLLAGDVDGIQLKRTRLVREGARSVLVVEVAGKRVAGSVGIDDTGTRTVGPLRADATVRVARLLAADDSLAVTLATDPAMPRELAYARVRYAKRLGADGTEASLAGSVASVEPGAYLAPLDIVGRSWTAQAALSRPLLRRQAQSWWLQGSADLRDVTQDHAGQRVRRDRIAAVRLGVYGYAALAGGTLRASATASEGLAVLGATGPGDPRASRPDADGRFTALAASLDWTGPLAGPLSAALALAGQVADRPLLLSEELGLGGGPFLRPYDYSERSGERGVIGSAELRYALAKRAGPFRLPQLYAFAGGGRVDNLRGGYGGGALFATGGGVRVGVGDAVSVDAGVAVPLSGPRYDTGNSDPVVNFRLFRRF